MGWTWPGLSHPGGARFLPPTRGAGGPGAGWAASAPTATSPRAGSHPRTHPGRGGRENPAGRVSPPHRHQWFHFFPLRKSGWGGGWAGRAPLAPSGSGVRRCGPHLCLGGWGAAHHTPAGPSLPPAKPSFPPVQGGGFANGAVGEEPVGVCVRPPRPRPLPTQRGQPSVPRAAVGGLPQVPGGLAVPHPCSIRQQQSLTPQSPCTAAVLTDTCQSFRAPPGCKGVLASPCLRSPGGLCLL